MIVWESAGAVVVIALMIRRRARQREEAAEPRLWMESPAPAMEVVEVVEAAAGEVEAAEVEEAAEHYCF